MTRHIIKPTVNSQHQCFHLCKCSKCQVFKKKNKIIHVWDQIVTGLSKIKMHVLGKHINSNLTM